MDESFRNHGDLLMINQQYQVSFKSGPVVSGDLNVSCHKSHGAACVFEGTVRDINMGRKVIKLCYDINQKLAQKIILDICHEASERYNCPQAVVSVIHSWGELKVGDTSVLVRVGTPHRREAFNIARYVIDELKHRSPIWKKEFYSDGDSGWLKGHTLCQLAHGDSGEESRPPV